MRFPATVLAVLTREGRVARAPSLRRLRPMVAQHGPEDRVLLGSGSLGPRSKNVVLSCADREPFASRSRSPHEGNAVFTREPHDSIAWVRRRARRGVA
jgi:hypothetical protein